MGTGGPGDYRQASNSYDITKTNQLSNRIVDVIAYGS